MIRIAYSESLLMKSRPTMWIFIALVTGIIAGYVCHTALAGPAEAKALASYFDIVTDVFLRLIRMIIAPLVFTTLLVGIAKMGDARAIGRIGAKTLLWFLGASLVSLLIGTVVVTLLQPGIGLKLPLPSASAQAGLPANAPNVRDLITHLVPRSIVEALANNEILQIVVFAAFFAIALMRTGDHGTRVLQLAGDVAHIMLRVTGYVMKFAPFAVFAAIASVVTTQGLGVLLTYGAFIGEFYASLALLWTLLVAAGFLVIGPRVFQLIGLIRTPVMLAFSTASSESAYPKLLENLQRFGVSERLASFILPLGYSFNLDGSMMYCSFATIFIAQAYAIHLSFAQLATMLGVLMLTSKGMAGVPKAALVVIAATLVQFHIPEVGLLIIMGVDTFLDMGRTATNVVGNSIAAVVLAKWEGELRPGLGEDASIEAVVAATS
jgi:Na+/H+-dicarboxylate symporter